MNLQPVCNLLFFFEHCWVLFRVAFLIFFSPNPCLVKQCVIASFGVKHHIVVLEYVSLHFCEMPVF